MSFDVKLREYSGGDIPALCALWESVFGDKAELIQEFFRLLPDMGLCAVAELDGKIVGMASVLTALELVTPGGDAARCGYVYAVATEPSFRGRGIGAALTEKVCELAKAAGASVVAATASVVAPAAVFSTFFGSSTYFRSASFRLTGCSLRFLLLRVRSWLL